MDGIPFAATLAAAIGAGIIGGIFFGFSTFIMAAFARIPTAEGIRAMQAINVTVLNPLFLLTFAGTGVFGAVAALYALIAFEANQSLLTIGGALLYIGGCLAVTGAGNVPRNNALDKVAADAPEADAFWRIYLREWTTLNTVRTMASLAAALTFTLALTLD